jgi:hypothetical protein
MSSNDGVVQFIDPKWVCDPIPGTLAQPCDHFEPDGVGDRADCRYCGHWEECHERK